MPVARSQRRVQRRMAALQKLNCTKPRASCSSMAIWGDALVRPIGGKAMA